jgi:hypothetical protein
VARAKGQKIEDHSLLDDSMDNTDDEQVINLYLRV